jgi:hypothetical protein
MISSGVGPFTTSSVPTTWTVPVNRLVGVPLVGTSTIGVVPIPAVALGLAVKVTPGPSTMPPSPETVPVRFSDPPLTTVRTPGPLMAPLNVTLCELRLTMSMPGGAPMSVTGCGIVVSAPMTNVPLLRVSVLVEAPSEAELLTLTIAPLVTRVPPW